MHYEQKQILCQEKGFKLEEEIVISRFLGYSEDHFYFVYKGKKLVKSFINDGKYARNYYNKCVRGAANE